MRTLAIVVVLAFATLGPLRVASAEPVVVAVDGKDIYIDLGARDGVGAGSDEGFGAFRGDDVAHNHWKVGPVRFEALAGADHTG